MVTSFVVWESEMIPDVMTYIIGYMVFLLEDV